MLAPGGHVAVCVSGGADSVALLHILHSLRGELSLQISVLHLNHCLRGEESDGDELFARELCAHLGVPFCSRRSDVRGFAASRGLSLEEAGRDLRYKFFEEFASERGAKIATAHTQNDNLETMLLNLARGTGPRGLAGIPPVRGAVVRPLIECSRAEVEAYLAEYSLPFREDSSNRDCTFARNRLRRKAVPVLLGICPAALENAAETAKLLRAEDDFLGRLAAAEAARIFDGRGFSRMDFLALDPVLSSRILARLLRAAGAETGRARIRRLMEFIGRGSGGEQLRPGMYFICSGKSFCIRGTPPPSPEPFRSEINLEKFPKKLNINVFSSKKLLVLGLENENYEEFIKNEQKRLKNALDYDRINRIIECRPRLPGDSIRLCGRGCTKSLKKLFSEARVPEHRRMETLVLDDGGGPVWVEGFGAAERVAVGPLTRRAVLLEISE